MTRQRAAADSERFERLYDDHRLEILGYCARRVSPDQAADACSEVFLVAWRRLESVPRPPETLPYLYGIASRVVSNNTRSSRRSTRLGAKLANLGVSPAVDPSVLVMQTDQDREVVAAIRQLKPRDREIVMLYAWEDLPRQTIAEMMDMTKTAIDQRIYRAYQRLARILAPRLDQKALDSPPIAQEGGT